ncbi:MAG: hypothetical protein ACYC3L_12715, partial [Gemmatimonadaceae bacterium]
MTISFRQVWKSARAAGHDEGMGGGGAGLPRTVANEGPATMAGPASIPRSASNSGFAFQIRNPNSNSYGIRPATSS